MPTYSTFHVPGIDAGVSLALDGNRRPPRDVRFFGGA